jgi:hypothetical protein
MKLWWLSASGSPSIQYFGAGPAGSIPQSCAGRAVGDQKE